MVYQEEGEWDKAELDLTRAIELNSNDAFALSRVVGWCIKRRVNGTRQS